MPRQGRSMRRPRPSERELHEDRALAVRVQRSRVLIGVHAVLGVPVDLHEPYRTIQSMRRRERAQALESHLRIAEFPRVAEQPLDQHAAGADAAHVRLDVHPLDLSDTLRQPLEAADADVVLIVPNEIEAPGGRIELRAVLDIGARHRFDVEGQPIARPRDVADPLKIFDQQQPCGLALLGRLDRHQLQRPSGSIPLLRIVPDARSDARNAISRFAASISFDPATTAAAKIWFSWISSAITPASSTPGACTICLLYTSPSPRDS